MDALRVSIRKLLKNPEPRQAPVLEPEDARLAPSVDASVASLSRPPTPMPAPTVPPAAYALGRPVRRVSFDNTQLPARLPPATPLAPLYFPPVTLATLEAEVEKFSAALDQSESACIAAVASFKDAPVSHDQWWDLIRGHKKLMEQHIVLFEKMFHPSGNIGPQSLAVVRTLAQRMCDHGVRGLLQLQTTRLPYARDYMNAFVDMAFLNIALMYETHPMFAMTWAECLGDIARSSCRSADEQDPRDWAAIAQHWYTRAIDVHPQVGRLQVSLSSVLPRESFAQFGALAKAATAQQPDAQAQTLLRNAVSSVLCAPPAHQRHSFRAHFVTAVGQILTRSNPRITQDTVVTFLMGFDGFMRTAGPAFKKNGVSIAITQAAALLDFRPTDNFLTRARASTAETSAFVDAKHFALGSLEVAALRARHDNNALPYVHASLAFLDATRQFPLARVALTNAVPRRALARLVEALLQQPAVAHGLAQGGPFASKKPLNDDYQLLGLEWSKRYYPNGYFSAKAIEDDARAVEQGTVTDVARKIRIAGLAQRVLGGYNGH